MLIENETCDFKELLHGVVIYMRSYVCCPTQCITLQKDCNPNSNTHKYAIPAMNELSKLGLGYMRIVNGNSFEFCKIDATTFKNNLDLQNSVRKLGLNVERVIQTFESGEQRRYN